ncbi:hypothetical protein [uncultured Cohaesibacter sp.]|uniref:hypothetical protein n=1 Tax=uncultured Cohaesibacter sp. TaxID=1002546 RepID=UPI002AA672D1|nr:hypothetical protein [uncultured Cohaesibacter sp.]
MSKSVVSLAIIEVAQTTQRAPVSEADGLNHPEINVPVCAKVFDDEKAAPNAGTEQLGWIKHRTITQFCAISQFLGSFRSTY